MAGATYLTSSPPPSSSSFLSKAAPLLPALLHHTSPLGGLSYAPQSQQHQLRLSIPCLLKVNMALPKASMALLRDSMVPLKGNITVHPKANLPCSTNKHLLSKVVASAA